LAQLIGLFLMANLVKAGLTALQLRLGFTLDADVLERIRSRVLRSIILPSQSSVTPKLSSLTMHFQSLSKFWGNMVWETLTSLLFMVGASIALFLTDQRLAVVAFIPVPVVLAVVLFLGPRFRRTMDGYFSGMDSVGQELLEVAANKDFIKVSGVGALVGQIFERNNRKVTARAKAFGFWAALYAPIFDFVGAAATALLVVAFAFWVASDGASAQTFLVFFVYLSYFYRPLYGASALSESWQKSYAAYTKFSEMDRSSALEQGLAVSRPLSGSSRSSEHESLVKFENVSFAYSDSHIVVSDLSMGIPADRRTGIIGGNGLGKSTVIKLLLGLLKPQSGKIVMADGVRSFAYLPQTVFLHSGPIMDNLLMAHPLYRLDLSEESHSKIIDEIYSIGSQIGVIQKLSKVDLADKEFGVGRKQLSGGQRQLVGLWRFAVQAEFSDLLVMDEPDSYLDIDGLNKVLPLVFSKFQNKTMVIVSHNARILEACETIFRLDNGKMARE
jgi:ABC-type multidrug transport system fused ATPase/permease subunit